MTRRGAVYGAVLAAGVAILMGIDAQAASEPIPFVPFRLEDLIDPTTNLPAKSGDVLHIEVDGEALFDGTADVLLNLLNDIERHYNALGQSLRLGGDLWSTITTDPLLLRSQLLSDLHITQAAALAKIRPPRADCPEITLAALGLNRASARQYVDDDKIVLDDGAVLTASGFVERINEQQHVLCALGWSILDSIGEGTLPGVQRLMDERLRVMHDLGISRFHRAFNMEAIKPLKKYGEIAAEAEALAAAKQVPSVQQLRELRGTLPRDPDYEIPDVPNVPTVEPSARKELQLHKRKTWEGLRRGDRGKFSVEADGYYELNGDEHAQESTAEAKATIYIAHHEIRALRAEASAKTQPDGVAGRVYLEVMGTTVAMDDEKGDKVTLADPSLLSYEFKEQITQQFSIGPVPVYLAEGATSKLRVGFELGLTASSLKSTLGPGADADAFVLAGVGMPGVSGGAACELKLLNLDAGLQGNLAVGMENQAEPLLEGDINVGLGYAALKGRVFIFADLPVPRWGWPPWGKKRVSLDIFNWAGFHGRHRLVNWGMRLTPHGARLMGDLADQTDRDEMRALDAAVDAEARARNLARLEHEISEREAQAYRDMLHDAGSEEARRIVRDSAFLQAQSSRIAALHDPLVQDLRSLLEEMRQD